MPLVFDIFTDISGTSMRLQSGAPADINMTINATSQPSGEIRWFLDFFKLSTWIVDVGFYLEWETPATDITSIVFDLPLNCNITPLIVPSATPPIAEDTVISPIKSCAFFEDQENPKNGKAWMRLKSSIPQFILVPENTTNSVIKVQSEFRYQTLVNIITV